MPFTLHNWNVLICTILNPANIHCLKNESINKYIEESNVEQDKVRMQFLEGILERPKVKDKQLYVKLNQGMLIRLLDKLYSYRQTAGINSEIIKLYETVSNHLQSILDFMEDFFGNYFDRNEKVPMFYLAVSLNELCRQSELIKRAVLPYQPYVHAIADMLVKNFDNFCLQKKSGATYNELLYQKELMNQLLTGDTLASENSIKEVLFYFNYNDADYVAYVYEKFQGLLETKESIKDKINALTYEQKKCNQLPARLDCSFSSAVPSLKEQVNQWIEAEIKFIGTEEIVPEKSEVYIHVPFKGSEIYLLHKSFLDSGGAPGETYKSLFDKTASHLANKNQRGFSSENLQKCSDRVDPEARENVKRFLQKMIRNIDSY